MLIDRVIVANGDVEIRYVIPTSPSSEHVRFCHLRSDYFATPDLIRALGSEIAQQIGIDPMLAQALAEIWAWRNTLNAHLAHRALHALAVDWTTFFGQKHGELARPIEGMCRIQLVNAMLERHLLRRWQNALIVQTAA